MSFRKAGKPWRFSDDPEELESAETEQDIVARIREEVVRNVARKLSAEERVSESLSQMMEVLDEEVSEQQPGARSIRNEVARIRDRDMPLLEKGALSRGISST